MSRTTQFLVRRSWSVVLAATIPVVLLAQGAAQQPAQTQAPTFRARVDLVQVDVTAVDSTGAPVRGLTAKDFIVLEGGKPQAIEHAEEISTPVAVAPTAPWMATVSSDVATNELQDRRLVAIVIDDAMLPTWNEAIKNTKTIAKATIDRLGPNDLGAVIFTKDASLSQEFTQDKARLYAAVEKAAPGFAYSSDRASPEPGSPPPGGQKPGSGGGLSAPPSSLKPPNPDEYWYKASVQVVTNVAEDLIAIPERRKLLVYIGIGVPMNPNAAGDANLGSSSDSETREMMIGIREKLEHTVESAEKANVTIYAFEPVGQLGLESFFQSGMAHNVGGEIPTSPPKPVSPAVAQEAATLHRDFVSLLASNTGGRSVLNTGTFTPGIDTMFRENESYYLLGYRQDVPAKPGEIRRLEVKSSRPGVTVRSRPLTYGKDERAMTGAMDMREAMSGLLPNGATPMRVTAIPFALPATYEIPKSAGKQPPTAAVAIVLGVTDEAPPERRVEHIEMLQSVFTSDGTPRGTQTQSAEVTIRPPTEPAASGPPARAAFEVLSYVPVRSGRQQLRLAVENTTNGKVGSIFIDVDVPDFVNAPISLSGLVFDEDPRMWYGPPDGLAAITSAVPTIHRSFTAASRVKTLVRVYQGGKAPVVPVAITTTITDEHNAVVSTTPASVGVEQFGAQRSFDQQFELPLATLKPGVYLLSIQAQIGADPRNTKNVVKREVAFTVR